MLIYSCQTEHVGEGVARTDSVINATTKWQNEEEAVSTSFFRDFPLCFPGPCADQCNALCPAACGEEEGPSSDDAESRPDEVLDQKRPREAIDGHVEPTRTGKEGEHSAVGVAECT